MGFLSVRRNLLKIKVSLNTLLFEGVSAFFRPPGRSLKKKLNTGSLLTESTGKEVVLVIYSIFGGL